MTTDTSTDRRGAVLQRIAPLTGLLFAGLSIAGDFTIGEFPDGSTPADRLPAFYAAHGAHVTLGGSLLVWGALCFGVFGAALWARVRRPAVPALVAGVVLLGAVIEATADLSSGAVYRLLGRIGVDPHVTAPALQAWHISGSEFGIPGGMTLFLLGVAVAGIAYRAVPRWLAWTALLLVITQFTPWSFLGSLVFLLWAAAAGITLAVRPGLPAERSARQPAPVG